MGIRKELMEEGTVIERKEEGIMIGRVKKGEEKWRIVEVYVWENLDWTLRRIEQSAEERDLGIKTLVGSDFNARTDEKGRRIEEKESREGGKERIGRKSKDKKVNREDRKFRICKRKWMEHFQWGYKGR